MKKILIVCLVAFGICYSSCTKEKATNNPNYDFAGVYTVMADSGYVSPGIINPDTLLVIECVNENEIKTKGYLNTTGTVRDNLVYFENIEKLTNTWYGNDLPLDKIEFESGRKEGNLIYITVTQESWVLGINGAGNSSGPHTAKIIAFKH